MNAAKYAQKLRHIRKVKAAIRYQQQTRKRLEPIKKQNRETKEYIVANLRNTNDKTKADARAARENAREDFELGPLRPNRAIGDKGERYGTMDRADFSLPQIPEHWFGAEKKVQKRMKTRIPEHIFRDQWPIVEGDRVVVIRGRELHKIGIVKHIWKEENKLSVTNVNKVWMDGRVYQLAAGEQAPVKREEEFFLPYDNVRLVAPCAFTRTDRDGQTYAVVEDVIVEKVDMERHTSGKNPFTGEEDAINIPEDQQVDPETDQKIWHRYIAGTRTVIDWPWQQPKATEDGDVVQKTSDDKEDSQGILRKTWGSLQSWRRSSKEKESDKVAAKEASREEALEEEKEALQRILVKPREQDPRESDDDTPRHIVEIDEMDVDNSAFRPTLLYLEMPVSVVAELRDLRAKEVDEKAADKEERIEQLRAQRRERKERQQEQIQARINNMKTPMQIRRELEQAKKQKHDPATPTMPSEALLLALGKRMEESGKMLNEERAAKAERHATLMGLQAANATQELRA